MYRLDKKISKAQTFAEAESDVLFPKDTPLGERLSQAWFLTCAAYGIDANNPPKMEKVFMGMRKHGSSG
ncbi:MAG: hypothetical protein ABIO05_03650 [Ferruginibacter sp.]